MNRTRNSPGARMSDQPLPCAVCGKPIQKRIVTDSDDRTWFECPNCEMRAPVRTLGTDYPDA